MLTINLIRESLGWIAFFAWGICLALFFYGGLWFTVFLGLSGRLRVHPSLWFFMSHLIRTFLTLLGFYASSAGDIKRLLIIVLGFFSGRFFVSVYTRSRTVLPFQRKGVPPCD